METEIEKLFAIFEQQLKEIISQCVESESEVSAEMASQIRSQKKAIESIRDLTKDDWRRLRFLKQRKVESTMSEILEAITDVFDNLCKKPRSIAYTDYTQLNRYTWVDSTIPNMIDKILQIPTDINGIYNSLSQIVENTKPKYHFNPCESSGNRVEFWGRLIGMTTIEAFEFRKKLNHKLNVIQDTGMTSDEYDDFYTSKPQNIGYICNLSTKISDIQDIASNIKHVSKDIARELHQLSVRNVSLSDEQLLEIFEDEKNRLVKECANEFYKSTYGVIIRIPEMEDKEKASILVSFARKIYVTLVDLLQQMGVQQPANETSPAFIRELYNASPGYESMASYYLYSGFYCFLLEKIEAMKKENPNITDNGTLVNIHVTGGINNFGDASQIINNNQLAR